MDFTDVFLQELVNVLLKQTRGNEHAIKLEKGKQPSYGPIYSLELVEFKTLKAYIKTKLTNGFIQASKLSAGTLILFVHKPNNSFYLRVNYRGLNNLTIKNWYLLPLIDEFLDWFSWAKQFT